MSTSAETCPSKSQDGFISFENKIISTQRIGRYVKIGLTERAPYLSEEHQDRQSLEEFEATPSKYIELMDYGETYLHHYFAGDRIGGEWFDLDDAFLISRCSRLSSHP